MLNPSYDRFGSERSSVRSSDRSPALGWRCMMGIMSCREPLLVTSKDRCSLFPQRVQPDCMSATQASTHLEGAS